MLDASDSADIDKALTYIACKQYDRDTGAGGFGALFESTSFVGCDLFSTYRVVRALNLFRALDRINQTMLMDFIVSRYNASTGAFNEIITEVDGKEYARSRFPLVFRSFQSHIAYSIPNIITTYAGVCVLKELGRLDVIDVSKTYEWVMHCQAENGMFKPYPDASYMPSPSWSTLNSNPFEVDGYGTGIPYTFVALSVLDALGS
jgi:prenyltransferase beta subunit